MNNKTGRNPAPRRTGTLAGAAALAVLAAGGTILTANPVVTGLLLWPQVGDQRQRSLVTAGVEDNELVAFARKHGYRPDEVIAMIEAIS
jgi:hypothetical protein